MEHRYNVLALELSTSDNVRWWYEIDRSCKRDKCLVTMRCISRFYNYRAQEVSGKNEQSVETPWRWDQCNCVGLRLALLLIDNEK